MKLMLKTTVAVAAILIAMNTSAAFGQFFFLQNPLLGKEAPDFTLSTVSGKQMNMSQFRGGKSAIIFFWATWCPHCRDQLRELNKNKRVLKKNGIKLILVDIGETAKQVKRYIDKNRIRFEVFLDQKNVIAEEYGLIGVPTFFFVKKNGVIELIEHALPDNYVEILNK